jgi:hypothetical protein
MCRRNCTVDLEGVLVGNSRPVADNQGHYAICGLEILIAV